MTEKEKPVLSDKSVIPTDDYIFSIIGERKIHWLRIMNFLSENYPDSSGTWNYYNDGKQWLFKYVRKKKTIFWSGILTDTFRITFYLGNKAETIIENSDLPQSIKEEFRTAKKYGLIRPVSFIIKGKTDVDNVLKMITIKTKIK
ncbi:MAG: DUF3788 family protein [Bacteroidales bacterium]|jgi:hypothetical protein